jgi:hypothetical protein
MSFNQSGSPGYAQVGCVLTSLGLMLLAVATFGLRHALRDMARAVPELPGLAVAFTHLVQSMLRSAAAQAEVTTAAVLIAFGLLLMYRGGR